jgi:hypothetical protein
MGLSGKNDTKRVKDLYHQLDDIRTDLADDEADQIK